MPSSRSARNTRIAISPRFATRTLLKGRTTGRILQVNDDRRPADRRSCRRRAGGRCPVRAGTSPNHAYWATAVFAVAMLTDQIDGWLARRSGQSTDLGRILDPVADKILVMAAMIVLVPAVSRLDGGADRRPRVSRLGAAAGGARARRRRRRARPHARSRPGRQGIAVVLGGLAAAAPSPTTSPGGRCSSRSSSRSSPASTTRWSGAEPAPWTTACVASRTATVTPSLALSRHALARVEEQVGKPLWAIPERARRRPRLLVDAAVRPLRVIEEDGRVAAFGGVQLDGTAPSSARSSRRSFRGQKMGSTLLDASIEVARDRGAAWLSAAVGARNVGGRLLLERRGFRPRGGPRRRLPAVARRSPPGRAGTTRRRPSEPVYLRTRRPSGLSIARRFPSAGVRDEVWERWLDAGEVTVAELDSAVVAFVHVEPGSRWITHVGVAEELPRPRCRRLPLQPGARRLLARAPRAGAAPDGDSVRTRPLSGSTVASASRRGSYSRSTSGSCGARGPIALRIVLVETDRLVDAVMPPRAPWTSAVRLQCRERLHDRSALLGCRVGSDVDRARTASLKAFGAGVDTDRAMRRALLVLVCLAALAVAPAAEGKASWAKHDIQAVVAAGLMAPSVAEFRAEATLTKGELTELLVGLGKNAACRADPSLPVKLWELDASLVTALGLGNAAKQFRSALVAAGLQPPNRTGTEVVARLLGLRLNHPQERDGIELRPDDPVDARRDGVLAGAAARAARPGRASPPFGEGGGVRRPRADRLAATGAHSRGELRRLPVHLGRHVGEGAVPRSAGRPRAASTARASSGASTRSSRSPTPPGSRRFCGAHDVRDERRGQEEGTDRLRVDHPRRRHLLRATGPKSKPGQVGHMGIYLGDGWFVHSSGRGTTIAELAGWYRDTFAWARRPLAEAGIE